MTSSPVPDFSVPVLDVPDRRGPGPGHLDRRGPGLRHLDRRGRDLGHPVRQARGLGDLDRVSGELPSPCEHLRCVDYVLGLRFRGGRPGGPAG